MWRELGLKSLQHSGERLRGCLEGRLELGAVLKRSEGQRN